MALDHESPMGASTVSDRPLDEFGEFGAGFMAFGRGAWIGTVAGVGVGLVIGVVNRIVMRIVAVMNGPTSIETDFGAKVLNFTAEGTMFLIIATMLFAIVPGLLYVGLRRFLPGGVVVGGLAFGLLLAAVFGTVVINSQARDFQLLGEPMVSAAMFLGMGVLFGLLIAPVASRLDRGVSRDPSNKVMVLYSIVGTLIVLLGASVLLRGRWSWLLIVPLGFAFVVSASERTGAAWTANRRLVRLGGYLSLGVPLIAGVIDVGQELSKIARI